MPVQASNRLFKLFYRTDDRLEVYPYAYRLEVYRTDRSGVYLYATGWLSYRTGWLSFRTGCPTRSVADCTTEIFVLVLSVSRTAKYLLVTGTPEEISLPRNVVRSVQIPLTHP
jgi:hypothetical protein